IAWVRQGGVAGITLFGLVSEGSALSPSERKLLLTHTCSILPPDEVLLVTVRPDDDVEDLVGCAVECRDRLGLIFQIGKDAGRSIALVSDEVLRPLTYKG
ncbi:MAG: hypothetical protein ACKOGK_11665, partial [Betaproteobacteria bacterium]